MNTGTAMQQVLQELADAQNSHPQPFHSAHEALGVLHQQVKRLEEEVDRENPIKQVKAAMKIAAIAMRFVIDSFYWNLKKRPVKDQEHAYEII